MERERLNRENYWSRVFAVGDKEWLEIQLRESGIKRIKIKSSGKSHLQSEEINRFASFKNLWLTFLNEVCFNEYLYYFKHNRFNFQAPAPELSN
jgi:hypothetical protein